MAFIRTNNGDGTFTITVSGVEPNLSGISGIPGVTTSTLGNLTRYELDSITRIVLDSTCVLSIDSDNEFIIIRFNSITASNAAFRLLDGSVFNLGTVSVVNGVTRYSSGVAMMFTGDVTTVTLAAFSSAQGSTVNWNGGDISLQAAFLLQNGAIITQNSGTIINRSTTQSVQLRISSTSTVSDALINFNNLTLDGRQGQSIRLFTSSGWNTGIFTFRNAYLQTFVNLQPNLLLENFNNLENVSTIDLFAASTTPANSSTITLRNIARELVATTTVTTSEYVMVDRAISLSFIKTDNTDAGVVSVYGRDTNNGSRFIGPKGQDDTADKVYSSNQTSPITFNILKRIINAQEGRAQHRYDDDRTNAQGTIPLRATSYLGNFTNISPELIGLSAFNNTYFITTDALVSELNESIVQAYTTNLNHIQAYDFFKSLLVSNYLGEAETIISRDSLGINARNYNVQIDGTKNTPPVFGGNTVIFGGVFNGDITTTGQVILVNGGIVNGNISDANGDSTIIVTTPVGYDNDVDVYNTLADAENEVNQISTGLNFRYLSAIFGGQTIWYRMTQVDGSYIIENYLIPAATGNYNVSLVVTSENAALGEIKAVTDRLDNMLEVINGDQVFKSTAVQNVIEDVNPNLTTINDNVKQASLIIPAKGDLQ